MMCVSCASGESSPGRQAGCGQAGERHPHPELEDFILKGLRQGWLQGWISICSYKKHCHMAKEEGQSETSIPHPKLDVSVASMAAATHGALSA